MPNMEHYHLKWNAHHEETFAAFESLLNDEAFADVVLSCKGMVFRAHRLVLSACSSYFRQTLQELARDNPMNQPVLFFRDTSPQLLSLLLNYMYQGEVEVPSTCLRDLMELADSLDIKGLRHVAPPELQRQSSSSGRDAGSADSQQLQKQPVKIWNPIADIDAKTSASSLVTPTGSPTGSPLNFSSSDSRAAGAASPPASALASVVTKLSGSAKRKRHLPLSTGGNGRKEANINNNSINGCDVSGARKAPELIPLEPPGSKIAVLMSAPDYAAGEGTSGEDDEPENLTVSGAGRSLSQEERESSPVDDMKPPGSNQSGDEQNNGTSGENTTAIPGGLPSDISPEYPVVFISSGLMRGRNKEGKTVHFCGECGYVSAHRGAVRRHLRTHTGEKPFQCDLCWRRFARKDHRNDHQVRCSGVQSLQRSAAFLAAAAAAASTMTTGGGIPLAADSPGNNDSNSMHAPEPVGGEVF